MSQVVSRMIALALSAVLLCLPSLLMAEHPPAPKLLPDRTAALLRVRDFPSSREKFNASALGRILQDEEVGPLVSNLYQAANETYAQVEAQVGLPLDKLLNLPQGEAWFAAIPSQHDGPMAFSILLYVGDQLPSVQKLIARGEEVLTENGGTKTTEKLGDVTLNIFLPRNVEPPRKATRKDAAGVEMEITVTSPGTIVQFERDGAIVITNSIDSAQEMLAAWSGDAKETLSQNDHFGAVMNRCRTGTDEPEFEWYVDPLALVRAGAKGNPTLQTGLAIVPALGLDGIQAVGGTITMMSGEFDGVIHTHLLLENPRSGILELLAVSSGDASPEPWVPADVISYATLNWDLMKSWTGGRKLYDSFTSEGQASAWMKERVQRALGIDFETELLPALEGRFSIATWPEPPARLNSQAFLIGMKLNDAKAFQPTLDKITEKFADRLEKKSFGSTSYHEIKQRNPRERSAEEQAQLREPQPAFAITGDYLLISDSSKFLEHAFTAQATGKSLADELDFKLIEGKIRRQSGGQTPALIRFDRPEEGLRVLYNYATGDAMRKTLGRQENEFLKKVDKAMTDHPLPPFAVISKYLAPGGGMMTSDETGFHFMSFTLKRK